MKKQTKEDVQMPTNMFKPATISMYVPSEESLTSLLLLVHMFFFINCFVICQNLG